MKIAIVTCYKYNDYIRARTLRAAFAACPGAQTLIVRNRHTGLLRYPEVVLRLIKTRFLDRPDVYVITFRGYEMLLWMRLILIRKPIIFDELVNFTEWMEEQGRLKAGSLPHRLFRRWNAWLVKRCRFILADTDAHAEHSAKLNMLSMERYRTVPVGTDETVFQPSKKSSAKTKEFTVVYYGNMLKLHGLSYVLQAAELLKGQPNIRFRLIGGKREVAALCQKATQAGAHITHGGWVPFEELPKIIEDAGLILGGPFGNTQQAQFVITGKTFQPLASGRPVLVGANQVHEGFVDKQNCLIVPQADSRALAEAIQWAYEHPRELERIGQAGHELYEQRFAQKIINNKIQAFVEAL
jgi:glycosyltransferase involved in cell wall biosynthesis